VRPALLAALQRAGCEVLYRRQTLRELGLLRYGYALRMMFSAFWVYRGAALLLRERTRAAFVARSRVNTMLVNRHAEVDAVILIAANSGYLSSLAARRPQLVIYTDYGNLLSKALPDRGFALTERKTHPVWNRLERQALLIQDRVFVMGQHVKPAMETAYGIAPEKIAAVGAGPGLDVDIERDRGTKDPVTRSILFVGKLAPVKGLAVLLQAFALVRAAYPDAVLHVVTGNLSAAPGVVSHTKLTERELKELFYRCSIFAMPAFKEPLGLVFLEAMWSKCACVGTSTGSMPEIIQDGVTGYLVEPGDSQALADRLMRLLADPATTRAMGERGYAAAKRYWNWDAVVARMLGAMR
jgi:glycosyltransferase involved in cell wall biosynthesis